jgi:adenylosuccinate synthase
LKKFVAHAAPCGIASNTDLGIGPQTAFDPEKFMKELKEAKEIFGDYTGRIMISERTGVLLDYHRMLDMFQEKKRLHKVGTTAFGIGPFYMCNAERTTRITFADYVSDRFPEKLKEVLKWYRRPLNAMGKRSINDYCEELLAVHNPIREELKDFNERLEYKLQEYIKNDHNIIIEGAQGTYLDVDMGTIPDQTSSHLLAQDAFSGLGLSRKDFKIYGIEKVYPTRVGSGPMPTLAEELQIVGENAGEKGATTGRVRRVGYPDWVLIRRAAMINDIDGIFLTRADNAQDIDWKVCTEYKFENKFIKEVPLDLSKVIPSYEMTKYNWHLFDAPKNLSNPAEVDEQLRPLRKTIVEAGDYNLPLELLGYINAHDTYVGRPIVGVSIGPERGETILR